MQYIQELFAQELIAEQFKEAPVAPPAPVAVVNTGDPITGLSSNTLTVGPKTGTVRNIEAPQAIGPGATPKFNALSPADVSGTNQPGLNFDIVGGKGTGNADPGYVAIRYPRRGASGSAVQSLTADRFPICSNLYTNTSNGNQIVNTAAETSIFTGATAARGATRTIEAGSADVGSVYRIYADLSFTTNGAPTGRFRVKLGSTTLIDTTAFTMPANAGGAGWAVFLDTVIGVRSVGPTGLVVARLRGELGSAAAGAQTPVFVHAIGTPTIDFTANQTLDITFEWGTADVNNIMTMTTVVIERIR